MPEQQVRSSRPGVEPAAEGPATAVSVLVRQLEAEGVRYIFGIPGGPLMPLYEAMFDSGRIRPIITKHEEGASFMADGYARVSGGLGVCCATTGPGATNALTGVACARLDSMPVLLITAQVAMEVFGKGAAQESSVQGMDTVELYRAATKASLMLLSPNRMAETARYLLRQAMTGRRGPVHLSLPADMVRQPVKPSAAELRDYRVEERCFDRDAVRAACERLVGAKRPAILTGYGVYQSRAWEELRRLAERLNVPVATTPKGKGLFPEDHELSLGVLGFAGSPQADGYILGDDVDVLMVVGSSLGELATHCWSERLAPSEALIHLDIDPTEVGKNYAATVGLVGDARTVLTEMLYEVERAVKRTASVDFGPRRRAVREVKREHGRCVRPEGFEDESMPLKPQRLIRELQDALPGDAILFVDIGNVMAWALHFLEVTEPGAFQINLGLASMGHAVASSIGGKLAAPDRPVVALVGDAAFAMNGFEVHAAVEANVPVIWVVMNNGGHGMVMHGERLQFKGKFETGRFSRPLEIAKLAEGMGARAYRVEMPGEFGSVFESARRSGAPAVIEVMVDPEEMPPLQMRIETLDKFFEGEGAERSREPEVVVRKGVEVGPEVLNGGNGRRNGHSERPKGD